MKLESGGVYRDDEGDLFIYIKTDDDNSYIYWSTWSKPEGHRWRNRCGRDCSRNEEYLGSINELLKKIAENN